MTLTPCDLDNIITTHFLYQSWIKDDLFCCMFESHVSNEKENNKDEYRLDRFK